MKERLVIWGASGHALVVADIIRLMNTYQIMGMIDEMNPERAASEFAGIQGAGWARDARQSVGEASADGDCRVR